MTKKPPIEDAWNEPVIVINGVRLTTAQAMTLRVALGSFALGLQDADALGDDEHGEAMVRGYKGAVNAIFRLIHPPP